MNLLINLTLYQLVGPPSPFASRCILHVFARIVQYKLKIAKEKYPSSDRSEKHFITLNTSSQEF